MHQLVDGNSRPLIALVGPGQAGDALMFPHLMRHLRIRRAGRGRARTRPDRTRGDKAYSSRAIRGQLRASGIVAVILERADRPDTANAGVHAVAGHQRSTPWTTAAATSSSAGSTNSDNGDGLATRHDKLASVYRSAVVLHTVVERQLHHGQRRHRLFRTVRRDCSESRSWQDLAAHSARKCRIENNTRLGPGRPSLTRATCALQRRQRSSSGTPRRSAEGAVRLPPCRSAARTP
ncbi:hypothetical protein [Amycolatopsis sp. NBC_01480]|uniref:hypothetical protein n=1 Tax=Amycolatopsis sp. NBC_01480 TaxID=2903562 RepID=UPI003FA44C65